MSTSYFGDNYLQLRFPLEDGGLPGFRLPQAGALHALAAHFSQRRDPAIITMPTGSGKTAVLCASPFLLRAERVLVLTPSRLVREQIVEEFSLLATLDALKAFGTGIDKPRTAGVKSRVRNLSDWESMRNSDVVVGTPSSLSPSLTGVPLPPDDLFDLILIDEAHHSPAETWKGLIKAFPMSRAILFTATPFRADRKELPGTFVYTYDLRSAYADGLYGKLDYLPIQPEPHVDVDLTLAKEAQRVYESDRASGLNHRIMVRTASVKKAHALVELYRQNTALKLQLVTGNTSLRTVKHVLAELQAGRLDGLICVDMLGEGFNFPNLKIAVLHSPHRSLGTTLQFIGRFARTTGANLGRAAFLAITSELEVERKQLYDEGSVWEELIPAMSSQRIQREQRTQRVLSEFTQTPAHLTGVPDLSLHSLRPYLHVKIYNMGADASLPSEHEMPGDAEIIHQFASSDQLTRILVTREIVRPRWTTVGHLDSIRHELYLLHLHRDSGLLFICSSQRSDDVYQHFATTLSIDPERPLRGVSPAKLNRILAGLKEHRFFNIGMKAAASQDREMSYKTIIGSSVGASFELNDSRHFYRGHWFGTAVDDETQITIGLSIGSKVWSNTTGTVPDVLEWCDKLASKISVDVVTKTHSGLDNLAVGEEVNTIPPNVLFVDWPKRAYTSPMAVRLRMADGQLLHRQLLDLEINVDVEESEEHQVQFRITDGTFLWIGTFSFETNRLVEPKEGQATAIYTDNGEEGDFIAFLCDYPPVFFTADMGTLEGFTSFPPPSGDLIAFSPDRIEVIEWISNGVNIQQEVPPPSPQGTSIQEYVSKVVIEGNASVVFYDHGRGEIADLVALYDRDSITDVVLYHCKGSGDSNPGSRVEDLYELCGQAIRSQNWRERNRLRARILRRLEKVKTSILQKGSEDLVKQLLGLDRSVRLEIVLVQPGLSKSKLNNELAMLLAAVDDFLYGTNVRRIKIWGSA